MPVADEAMLTIPSVAPNTATAVLQADMLDPADFMPVGIDLIVTVQELAEAAALRPIYPTVLHRRFLMLPSRRPHEQEGGMRRK